MIAFATQVAEVAPLIACASRTGFQAIPRGGRHQYVAFLTWLYSHY